LLVNAEYSSIEHSDSGGGAGGRTGGSMARGAAAAAKQAGRPGADLSAVIGGHVREFRRQQGDTLRALSARSGLSVGFLSQLERGQTSIGLTTLRDLAHCLGHEIGEFFDEQIPPDVAGGTGNRGQAAAGAADGAVAPASSTGRLADGTRASAGSTPEPLSDRYFTLTRSSGEHTSQYLSGLRTYRMLSQRAPGLLLEPMLVQIAPGGRTGEPEVHDGEEFAYVVSGELTFTVAGTSHRLGPGDSLHLKSAIPHQLHNDTDDVVTVVSVVTPRLF
jgi:quercetin dioxygenase-like cupin family protein